jgi:hypothetical protein
MKITEYEIINHGWDHCQYFPGCGVCFTKFEHVVTGGGADAVDAYRDAVEQIWTMHDADALPVRPRGLGINRRAKVPASHQGEDSEFYWYVSIRYNVSEE